MRSGKEYWGLTRADANGTLRAKALKISVRSPIAVVYAAGIACRNSSQEARQPSSDKQNIV